MSSKKKDDEKNNTNYTGIGIGIGVAILIIIALYYFFIHRNRPTVRKGDEVIIANGVNVSGKPLKPLGYQHYM